MVLGFGFSISIDEIWLPVFDSFLQLCELEEYGYEGFAFAFCGDDVEMVGTSSALKKVDSNDIHYLHSLVTIGKLQ